MTFLGRPFALPFPWASQYCGGVEGGIITLHIPSPVQEIIYLSISLSAWIIANTYNCTLQHCVTYSGIIIIWLLSLPTLSSSSFVSIWSVTNHYDGALLLSGFSIKSWWCRYLFTRLLLLIRSDQKGSEQSICCGANSLVQQTLEACKKFIKNAHAFAALPYCTVFRTLLYNASNGKNVFLR